MGARIVGKTGADVGCTLPDNYSNDLTGVTNLSIPLTDERARDEIEGQCFAMMFQQLPDYFASLLLMV